MTPEWMQQAICQGMTELFFPKFKERPETQKRREDRAAIICRQCPVMAECREYGRNNHEYGVWGGEGEVDRYMAGFALPDLRMKIKRRELRAEKAHQNTTTSPTPITTETLSSL